MATIHDVARRAGVSITTVSKVLNQAPYVRAATRERVETAMTELGYRPNMLARNLPRKKARVITVDLIDTAEHLTSGAFFFELLTGIGRRAAAAGHDVLWSVAASDTPSAHAQALVEQHMTGRTAGVVVVGPIIDDPRLEALRAAGVPYVVVGHPPDDSPSVDTENEAAGAAAAAACLALGHRRFSYLGGGQQIASRDRLTGYRVAIEAGGGVLEEAYVHGDGSRAGAGALLEAILAAAQPPTTLLCFGNTTGFNALAAATALGLCVPDDLSVVVFDDAAACRLSVPPLAAVAQDVVGLGSSATQLLLELVAGRMPPDRRILLPARLVLRESLAPPARRR